MKNKEIQEKRIKEYFIQATKEILKGEGLQSISVRNVADKAGYSYATLYNYFKDINELVFLCVSDFQEECRLFVAENTSKRTEGIDKLKATVLWYINYFIEYPGIFELFYLAKVSDFGHKQSTMNIIGNSLDKVCETEWNYCINQGLLKPNKAENLKSQLRFIVIGMLLLFMNRRTPDSYNDFINQINFQINNLFESIKSLPEKL